VNGAGRLRRWTVTVAPGDVLAFVALDWADTLVVVERGALEIECLSGRRATFAGGAVLAPIALPVRSLRNPGCEPLVLRAVRRNR
jgi:hypothetical protein